MRCLMLLSRGLGWSLWSCEACRKKGTMPELSRTIEGLVQAR